MKRKITGIVAFTILAISQNMHGESVFQSYKRVAFNFIKQYRSEIFTAGCTAGITGVLMGTFHGYRINKLKETVNLLHKKKKCSTGNSPKITTSTISIQTDKSLDEKRISRLKMQNKQFKKGILEKETELKKNLKNKINKAVTNALLEMNTVSSSYFEKIEDLFDTTTEKSKKREKKNNTLIIKPQEVFSIINEYKIQQSLYFKNLTNSDI